MLHPLRLSFAFLRLNDNVFDAEPLVAIAEGIGANPRSALQELL